MATFLLKIVSPDGVKFEGEARQLNVRTTTGEMGILAGHIPCVAPLGMGRAAVITPEQTRYAACIGGMVSVQRDTVILTPTTFEWADEIDLPRVERSMARAQAVLDSRDATDTDIRLAKARLYRALIRQRTATEK